MELTFEDLTETSFEIDDSLVILDGEERELNINGTRLFYREGVWCEKYDGEFMPDWCLTWFYKDPERPEDYFYFEQDPPETVIHNLLHMM